MALLWPGNCMRAGTALSSMQRSASNRSDDREWLIAASYCAMRLNAATDSEKRSGSDNVPLARSSASTDGYCAASVSTPTCCQFLTALRTIAGPPMSMFSTASARVQAAWATVASNGYRLTTSRSMVAMPCSFRAAICPGRSRQAGRPGGAPGGGGGGVRVGVEGVEGAVEHFGPLRQFGHLGHRQTLASQQPGRAAGGQQPYAQRVQGLREFDDAGLVGDGQECVHEMR